jgi:hypothetical protein
MWMTQDAWTLLITSQPPHKGFKFQPVDEEDGLKLRVFLENLAEFPESQRQDLAVWIGSLCQKIRDMGIPCYIEGA